MAIPSNKMRLASKPRSRPLPFKERRPTTLPICIRMIVASVMPVAEWQVRHRFDADFLAFRGDPPQLLVVFRAACLTVANMHEVQLTVRTQSPLIEPS